MQGSILKFPVYAPEGMLWAFQGRPYPRHSAGWRLCSLCDSRLRRKTK